MAFRDHNKAADPSAAVAVEVAVTDEVRNALADLERKGRLTADEVVSAARDPASPLHRHFDWDNDVAADSWRIEQARRLIRGVKVIVEHDEIRVATPRYVRDAALDGAEQGYVTMEQIRREPANAAALLVYEFGRAVSHCRRSLDIAEVVGVEVEAQKIIASIERLLKRLS